jgi:hypothetical protein
VNPGVAVITAGSLDNPGAFKPQAVLYASQGHAWDHLNPELPKFEKLPLRGLCQGELVARKIAEGSTDRLWLELQASATATSIKSQSG